MPTHVASIWGEQIEDRGCQITFPGLDQQAPTEEKEKWDPDVSKRKKINTFIACLSDSQSPTTERTR